MSDGGFPIDAFHEIIFPVDPISVSANGLEKSEGTDRYSQDILVGNGIVAQLAGEYVDRFPDDGDEDEMSDEHFLYLGRSTEPAVVIAAEGIEQGISVAEAVAHAKEMGIKLYMLNFEMIGYVDPAILPNLDILLRFDLQPGLRLSARILPSTLDMFDYSSLHQGEAILFAAAVRPDWYSSWQLGDNTGYPGKVILVSEEYFLACGANPMSIQLKRLK